MPQTPDFGKLLTDLVPFVSTVGIRIDRAVLGEATATLPSRPAVHNHMGTAHAGAAYTLGESASGAVVLSMFGDLLARGVFVALKSATVAHHKAAAGDVVAEAKLDGDPAACRAAYEATGKVDFDVIVPMAVGDVDLATMVFTWAVRAPR